MARIEYPFVRGREYPFSKLTEFRSDLLAHRQNDQNFSGDIRLNKLPWAKVYNEEIVPIALLADVKRFEESETFKLMPEGDPADIELGLVTGKLRCQVTLADPVWSDRKSGRGSGYLSSLRMRLLSEGFPAFGGRKIHQEKNGEIVSVPDALSQQKRNSACRLGLRQAMVRKQKHDGTGFALLIYARELCFQLIDCDRFELSDFVSDAMRDICTFKFRPLWVVDDGFLWEHQ